MSFYFKNWWKYLSGVLIAYAIVMGFLIKVPALPVLNETIRNLFFHVPIWFAMMILLLISLVNGLKYLSTGNMKNDYLSVEMARVAIVFGLLGFATGTLWANYTWGSVSDWLVKDPKVLGSMLGMLVYFAYFVLRGSINNEEQRAKISAVYNVFGFAMFFIFIWITPRLTDSLHPGNGGNPGFNAYDMDSRLRLVFYPAVIGYSLLGIWIGSILFRMRLINEKFEND